MTVADRVAEAAAGYVPPRPVTQEEFDAIGCNRCGRCCEDIPAPESPQEMAAIAADPDVPADTRLFAGGLEPVRPIPGGWQYRCVHAGRDRDGAAVCAVYEHRPTICRRFPVGPIRRWSECAWYVRIEDPAPVPVTLTTRDAATSGAPRLQAFYDALPAAERDVFDAMVRRAADGLRHRR